MSRSFTHFANRVAYWAGQPFVFGTAFAGVIVWLCLGPVFGWSDGWFTVFEGVATVTTFLVVFVIQNSQNRDTMSLQIKLDELIRVSRGAPQALLELEDMPVEELEALRKRYIEQARKSEKKEPAQGIPA